WLQQFWNTAKVRIINEVAHIEAKVARKKILVSEASVRTDLMFNDEDGTNCFDNQVIWDTLRDIGYEGSLTLLSFSKPLLSPQWKYLVHTLLHCLSSKSSSWDQFGTNIASALVGLATNQKFNFSKLIFDGMLRNLKDSKPFLMYPRFIQLFLNKQLEGSTKPQTFLPTVVLPPKVFTFMSKCSPKFSGKLTPLTPPMLEVATAVRAEHSLHTEELDIPTSSHHSDDSSDDKKAESPSPVASARSASPNDYTPTDEVQTSGGDEGHLDLHGLTREVLKLKKQNAKQAAQILRLKTKLKILVKKVKPVIAEYSSFVKLKPTLSKKKKLKKAHKKKSSSFKQGRKKVSDGKDEQAIKEMNVKAEEPSKKRKGTIRKMKSSRIIKKKKIQKPDDELKNFLKVVDFEGDSAQDVEVMEQRSLISRFSIVQSPEGEYIVVQRANGHIRAFNILDRQYLHHLHRLVIEYYEHIPPTGLGLIFESNTM
ncbi:hypothetical protein Tco_1161792, partial [Tanacetum coccineum]